MGNKLAMEESLAEVKKQALTGPTRRLPIFVTRTTLKDLLADDDDTAAAAGSADPEGEGK